MQLDRTELRKGELDQSRRDCCRLGTAARQRWRASPVTPNTDGPFTVSPLVGEAQQTAEELLHPLCLRVYTVATERAFSRPNIALVARALSWSTRHLERRFVDEGLPPPHRLVTLARWIPVSRTLANKATATSSVARALGFTSTRAFCHAVRRELRMTIGEIRSFEAALRITHDLVTAYQVPVKSGERRKSDTACQRRLKTEHITG
jgi:AraC-like DNA-binding protein